LLQTMEGPRHTFNPAKVPTATCLLKILRRSAHHALGKPQQGQHYS
jgi:hypothetical protein